MEITSVKNSDNNMGYHDTLSVLIPLDSVYAQHMPRDRHMIEVWLNGTMSPYSVALAFVDRRQKQHSQNNDEIWGVLTWLSNVAERRMVFDYISTLTDLLEQYVIPLLKLEGISLDDVCLLGQEETVIDEWSCGYVTLTFKIPTRNATGSFIGTPYTRPDVRGKISSINTSYTETIPAQGIPYNRYRTF